MMIPGAWEPRGRSVDPVSNVSNVSNASGVGAVKPLASVPRQAVDGGGNNQPHVDAQRPEPAGWLKVSIFAGTLIIAMWLAMSVFFQRVVG
jgi:hypothetical protein